MEHTDTPALRRDLKAYKHRNRLPQVYRPDSALTPIEQADAAARRVLDLALVVSEIRQGQVQP